MKCEKDHGSWVPGSLAEFAFVVGFQASHQRRSPTTKLQFLFPSGETRGRDFAIGCFGRFRLHGLTPVADVVVKRDGLDWISGSRCLTEYELLFRPTIPPGSPVTSGRIHLFSYTDFNRCSVGPIRPNDSGIRLVLGDRRGPPEES